MASKIVHDRDIVGVALQRFYDFGSECQGFVRVQPLPSLLEFAARVGQHAEQIFVVHGGDLHPSLERVVVVGFGVHACACVDQHLLLLLLYLKHDIGSIATKVHGATLGQL